MKIVGECLPNGKAEGSGGVAGATCCTGAVERAVHGARLLADVFHDVDFTGRRPAGEGDVVAEHPESGPRSLACRDFDARFKAAVSLAEKTLGLEAGGSVVARNAVRAGEGSAFLLRGDDKIAALDVSVLQAVGVALEFIVAPAFAAQVVSPLLGIRRRTVWTVEFVGPDEGPAGRRWLRRGRHRINGHVTTADEKRDEQQYQDPRQCDGFGHGPQGHRLKSVLLREIQGALKRALFVLDLFLKLENGVKQRLGPGRAAGHVNVHGNYLIAALHDSVVIEDAT